MKITVLTVYWEGDFRGRTYTPEWAWKMRDMVSRLLPEAEFHTLSNNDDVPGYIPLIKGWPGWWSKIELFRPSLPVSGRILYFDLDTILIGGLEELAEFSAPVVFSPPSFTFVEGRRPVGGANIVDRYNSSVIAFNVGEGERIYSLFSLAESSRFRGDQDWAGHIFPGAATFPPHWFRKLRDCRSGPPSGVKVVFSMPEKNDVAAKRYPWVRELWG